MAASIFAKTATATGTLQSGRTRLKAFIVKTASSGSPQVVFKNGSGGATQLDVVFNTSDWVQVSIPDHGVIFDDE
jgi:hypothetical protein